jgi:nitrite reductase/ring-hydroxylating ferredoxin subunit
MGRDRGRREDRWNLPDVRELATAPIIGQRYRVPCVCVKSVWFPVLGPPHTDPELFHPSNSCGTTPHYHYDFRFFSPSLLETFFSLTEVEIKADPEKLNVLMARIAWDNQNHRCPSEQYQYTGDDVPLEMGLKARRCYREMPTFPIRRTVYSSRTGKHETIQVDITRTVERMCARKRVNLDKPVCPHRGFPLHQLPQDSEGRVICPGHGLCISLRTGEIVLRYAPAAGEEALSDV